jgi:agmatine/peptidylarginine deiminase
MKRKYIHWLLITLHLSTITGCFVHRDVFDTPDIILKDSGQPCISIPSKKDFFKKDKKFNAWQQRWFRLVLDNYRRNII